MLKALYSNHESGRFLIYVLTIKIPVADVPKQCFGVRIQPGVQTKAPYSNQESELFLFWMIIINGLSADIAKQCIEVRIQTGVH